jgi:hypothetical protein
MLTRVQSPLACPMFCPPCQSHCRIVSAQSCLSNWQPSTTLTKMRCVSARKSVAPSRVPQTMFALVSSEMSRSCKTRRSRRVNSKRRLKSLANISAIWFAVATTCDRQCNESIWKLHHQQPFLRPCTKQLHHGQDGSTWSSSSWRTT